MRKFLLLFLLCATALTMNAQLRPFEGKNGKYGYKDASGKVVIPLKYDNAGKFSDGLAAVKLDEKYGFIDKSGKVVIELKYDGAGEFSDGAASVYLDRKYGFIDKSGTLIIPFKYEGVGEFSEGFVLVTLNGMNGFIDKTGKAITEFKYGDTFPPAKFSGGLAVVMRGKFGYINTKGQEIIPLSFDDAEDFIKGKAKVKLNGKVFYIDRTGKEIK